MESTHIGKMAKQKSMLNVVGSYDFTYNYIVVLMNFISL